MGIRVFIVGYVREYEKSFLYKTGGFGDSLATGTSRKFQSPNNKMARMYFFSCSALVVVTLQLPTCFTRVALLGESSVASHS